MKGRLQELQSIAHIPEVHTIFRRCHDLQAPVWIIQGVTIFMYSKAVHLEPWLHVYSANTLPMRTRWNIIEDLQATPTIWLSPIDCFVINTTKACVKDFMDVKGDLLEKNHTVACLHFEELHDIDAHKGKYIPLV